MLWEGFRGCLPARGPVGHAGTCGTGVAPCPPQGRAARRGRGDGDGRRMAWRDRPPGTARWRLGGGEVGTVRLGARHGCPEVDPRARCTRKAGRSGLWGGASSHCQGIKAVCVPPGGAQVPGRGGAAGRRRFSGLGRRRRRPAAATDRTRTPGRVPPFGAMTLRLAPTRFRCDGRGDRAGRTWRSTFGTGRCTGSLQARTSTRRQGSRRSPMPVS